MELPHQLRSAIENELYSSVSELTSRVSFLSESYRSGTGHSKPGCTLSREDVSAYTVYRMPATYAAVYASLTHAKERFPGWTPSSLLDVGAGPGTVMWAAGEIWPELKEITLVERNGYMIDLGKKLSIYSHIPAVKNAEWINADIMDDWDIAPNSIVTASYVLNELSEEDGTALVNRLWGKTQDVLVIIEPGTPESFMRLKMARDLLISQGAITLAPCPHNNTCPVPEGDWCHFSQRVARTRLHRMVKSGTLSYEDEKFSFLCMSRNQGINIDGLVIRHPQIRKGHIKLKLCTSNGITECTVTRKNKEEFRHARKLLWGSVIRSTSKESS